MPTRAASPAASSSTARAFLTPAVRHGRRFGTTRTTRCSRSRKTTSIGNRMKNVWIDPAGSSSRPSPCASPRRPSSPRMRVNGLRATVQRRAYDRVVLVSKHSLQDSTPEAFVMRRRSRRVRRSLIKRSATSPAFAVTYLGSSTNESIERGIGQSRVSLDDCPIERTRRRGHARDSWRSHVVAMYAAEALKFDHNADASHTSNRPVPVASTVVPFDCSRGGETR